MSRRKTAEEFITESRAIHGDKYDYSKLEYTNNNSKVCIICPKHGEFWQTPHSHLNGSGCPKCGDEITSQKLRKGLDKFISEAKEKYGDKYDYSEVEYINSKKKIIFICHEHGRIEQTPCNHLEIGCPLCSLKEKRGKNFHQNGYWSYETTKQTAESCMTKCEFKERFPGGYGAALDNGWLNDFTWLKDKDTVYWTYERTKNASQVFDTYTAFRKGNEHAYNAARRNGWLDDYTWLKQERKPNGYWHSFDNCAQASRECQTRGEFARKYGGGYMYNLKKGWLDKFTWLKDERFDLLNDKIDCVYAYEFKEQHAVYVGRTLMRLKDKRDKGHLFYRKDSVAQFAYENNIPVPDVIYLEEDLTIKEGAEKEGWWIEKYREEGWIILNKMKAGSIGRIGHWHSKFTKEACLELAKDCISRSELKTKSRQAYNIARKEGWIEEYTWFGGKGETISKKKLEFTYDICFQEAQKYDTLKSFAESSPSFYEASRKHGYLKDFTWLKRSWEPKWNRETCYKTAILYTDLSTFRAEHVYCYEVARKNGWLSQYVWLANNKFVDKAIRFHKVQNLSDTPIDSQPQ